MRRSPRVRFFFYTRSWQVPAVRAVLDRMAGLPNSRAWFSADRDTGVPAGGPGGVAAGGRGRGGVGPAAGRHPGPGPSDPRSGGRAAVSPPVRPFWDAGLSILDGRDVPEPAFKPLRSPKVAVTLAAAQMPCSRSVADNLTRMTALIRAARAKGADVVAFPELAVTGARAEHVAADDEAALRAALAGLQAAARAEGVAVAFGMPFSEDGRRYNGAFVVGPDGALLTRYAQLVLDRPDLFAPGTSTKAMWFRVKGVPAVVTAGRDARWSEVAELAAVRGAQVHPHLANDPDTSEAGTLFRKQVGANLASLRTFTVTVNAAAPGGPADAGSPANGGSAIWEDFHRGGSDRAGGYLPHSAVRVAEAGPGSELLTATRTVADTNPHLGRVTGKTNPQMRPWYLAGAAAIAAPAGR